MTNGQVKLINYVWHNCLAQIYGSNIFNGDRLAKEFLEEGINFSKVRKTLNEMPGTRVNSLSIVGSEENFIEVKIDSIYCTDNYRKLTQMLAGNYDDSNLDMSVEEVRAFKKNFFGELMAELKT